MRTGIWVFCKNSFPITTPTVMIMLKRYSLLHVKSETRNIDLLLSLFTIDTVINSAASINTCRNSNCHSPGAHCLLTNGACLPGATGTNPASRLEHCSSREHLWRKGKANCPLLEATRRTNRLDANFCVERTFMSQPDYECHQQQKASEDDYPQHLGLVWFVMTLPRACTKQQRRILYRQ